MSGSPLYKTIAEKLSEAIKAGRYTGRMLPPESELCKEFSASRITVRGALRILEESGQVEPIPGKGRRIVRSSEIAIRKRLSQKDAKPLRINCAVQNSTLRAYQQIFNDINNMALDDGYRCSVHFVGQEHDQSSFERVLKPSESDGLICVGLTDYAFIERVESCGVPAVHVNSSHSLVSNEVSTDDFAGGFMVGMHFAKHGHRKALIIEHANYRKVYGFESRKLGFFAAYSSVFGTDFNIDTLSISYNSEQIMEYLRKQRPEAVFMISDMLSRELFEPMDKLGLKFPQDIAVAGYDNMINTPEEWKRDIDSIEQPWTLIAEVSYRRLMELIAVGGKLPPSRILLRPNMVVKGSVT